RSKEPERWIEAKWGFEPGRNFDCRITLLVENEPGVLARVASEIGEGGANISHVNMDENQDHDMNELEFTIQVEGRVHLARVIRNVRRVQGVARVVRERG
ncbi:MAG: hypothetical protein RL748_936, partial [Pseudomonadota bacterium]